MLKTQPGRTTAAKVTAAATGGAVLVHSVKDRSALANLTASALVTSKSEFGCKSCGTHIIASSHAAPSCTTCGSETKVIKAKATPKHKGVVPVLCSHCNSVHLMEPGVITACNTVHCSVCGGTNVYDVKKIAASTVVFADAEEMPPMEAAGGPSDMPEVPTGELASDMPAEEAEASADDAGDAPVEAAEPAEEIEATDQWPFDGDEPAEEATASDEEADDEIAFESTESTEAGADDDEEDDEEIDDLAVELEDLDTDGAPVEEESPAQASAEDGMDEEMEAAGGEMEYEVQDLPEGDQLADAMSLDDTADGLSFQATAGRLVAMKGHVAVASLVKAKAGRNADIMMTAGFAAAITQTAKKQGMRKALASVGFTPIRIQTLTKASMARKVQEVQQAAVNSAAAKTATFTESLALAAAGLARGAWKGKNNPLKDAFVQAFNQLGAKNAEKIVARVLADHSVDYTRVLAELASELNSMSSATRKETAKLLDLTQVTASAEEVEDEDDDQQEALASNIEGRLRATAAVLPSVLSSSVSVGRRDSSRQAVQAAATNRALDILNGDEPLMLG